MSQTEDTTTAPAPPPAPAPERAPSERRRGMGSPLAWLTAVIAILVLVVVAVGGAAWGRSSKPGTVGTITVSGSGTIQGTPNTVSFNVGVHTVKATAQSALEINDLRLQNLERTLVRYGVARKDLQTSNLSIYDETNSSGIVTGFAVDDSLNVTFPNSAHVGTIIDAAARAAGNGISFGGISFSISNESGYLASARARAMHNARTIATQDAVGGHTTLGRIVRVTDEAESSTPIQFDFNSYAQTAALPGVPVEVGRQPVSVQVTVVYDLAS
jgi:uncharacterized protein